MKYDAAVPIDLLQRHLHLCSIAVVSLRNFRFDHPTLHMRVEIPVVRPAMASCLLAVSSSLPRLNLEYELDPLPDMNLAGIYCSELGIHPLALHRLLVQM